MAEKPLITGHTPKAIGLRLLINNRFWLLCFSGLLSLFVWVAVWQLVPDGELQVIRLEQIYGFISLTYLYFALLASPLTKAFPNLPGKDTYLFLRRAIGVSSFYFASLHASIAFFGQLQGFAGVSFLSNKYSLALILGAVALVILFALAATSVDKIIDYMTFPRWKRLHRFIYAAGWLVLGHTVLIGTHFGGSNQLPGRIVFGAVLFLLLLEALRVDRALKQRMPSLKNFGVMTMLVIHLLFIGFGYLAGRSSSFDIQSNHAHGSNDTPAQITESTGHNHGGATTTDPPVTQKQVGNQRVEINQSRFDLQQLLQQKQIIRFTITPSFAYTTTDCFLIHQITHAYIQGTATSDSTGQIDCLPTGDDVPPVAGEYYAYVRLVGNNQALTTKFDIELLP